MKRRCFRVIVEREWCAPGNTKDWDVDEIFRGTFSSLRDAVRESNLDRRVWGQVTAMGIELTEPGWERDCDDYGRSCQDLAVIERCDGMPLSWHEYTTARRYLGIPVAAKRHRLSRASYERQWARAWLRRQQREL